MQILRIKANYEQRNLKMILINCYCTQIIAIVCVSFAAIFLNKKENPPSKNGR